MLQAYEHAHELYRASPRWCLDWRYRGARLLAEIAALRPDIGCLQEVDQLPQFQAHLTTLGCAPRRRPAWLAVACTQPCLRSTAADCQHEVTPAVSAARVLGVTLLSLREVSLPRRANAGMTCATCGARATARTAA